MWTLHTDASQRPERIGRGGQRHFTWSIDLRKATKSTTDTTTTDTAEVEMIKAATTGGVKGGNNTQAVENFEKASERYEKERSCGQK